LRPLLQFTAMNHSVSQLCPNCGLCCDSTLFADVELRRGDDACFDGKLCRIYDDRPKRCRSFECGLLKKVGAKELSAATALKKISEAKILVKKIRELLRSLGQNDERLALTKRYAQAMSAPVDLSASENDSGLRGELMLAVNELMQTLQRDFLSQ